MGLNNARPTNLISTIPSTCSECSQIRPCSHIHSHSARNGPRKVRHFLSCIPLAHLRELSRLDAIELHPGARASFDRLDIRPLAREAVRF